MILTTLGAAALACFRPILNAGPQSVRGKQDVRNRVPASPSHRLSKRRSGRAWPAVMPALRQLNARAARIRFACIIITADRKCVYLNRAGEAPHSLVRLKDAALFGEIRLVGGVCG
jgi:hypothetical protein